jgi:hypothetical protein
MFLSVMNRRINEGSFLVMNRRLSECSFSVIIRRCIMFLLVDEQGED